MASATASRPPAAPPPPPPPPPAQALQWLGPRVSFSLDDAAAGREAAAGGREPGASADFEFLLGCSAVSMLPADELFSGGKLVPLRIPAATEEGSSGAVVPPLPTKQGLAPAQQRPETPRAHEVEVVAAVAEEEPKIPARRWRDLLRLRKQQQQHASSSSSEPRPLRRLLRRGPKPPEPEPSLSLPLLPREPAEKTATPTAQPVVPTPTLPPPPSQQHQNHLPPKIRMSPAAQGTSSPSPPPPPPPPPPPAAVAADSPRLNAAGKVVFNGLGRSSSSPSSLAGGGRRTHHRGASAIERSYSAHVRVAPVLNVPVCSLRGGSRKSVSVFGIDRLFSSTPSSSATASANPAGGGKKAKATKKEVTAAATQ